MSKKYFHIVILLVLLISRSILSAQDNNNVVIESIFSNINLMNEKIYNLNNKLKSINTSLAKNSEKLQNVNSELTAEIQSLKDGLIIRDSILNEQKNQIIRIASSLDSQNQIISNIKNMLNDINTLNNIIVNSLDSLENKINLLEIKISKLPKILFEPDLMPLFAISIGGRYFPELNNKQIEKPLSILTSLRILALKNWLMRANISAPLEFSSITNQSYWVSYLYSFDINYKVWKYNNLDFYTGMGLFYAKIKQGQNPGIQSNPFGLVFNAEVSYNQIKYKIPIEVFLDINLYVSNKKIYLQSNDNLNNIDLGSMLFSLTFGISFDFW